MPLATVIVAALSTHVSFAQAIDPDMQRVLTELTELGPRPLPQLTPEQARRQPTPADAAMQVAKKRKDKPPMPQVDSRQVTYESGGERLPITIYTPAGVGDQALPVIVYYHGGGWVIADTKTYEASGKALADKTKAIVASVEYRHAPEHKFPAAHEDAFAAYKWLQQNAKSFGGNPNKLAVAGESAGGNLAANVAIMARDQDVAMPAHMLLVYPVAGSNMNTESYLEHANAKPLGKPEMQWFVKHALKPGDEENPMINLVQADLKGLPPATVITAEIDPLRSEGRMLADRLQQAGVKTTYRNFDGVAHEFFGMGAVVADAATAQDLAARQLRQALGIELPRQPGGQ